MRSGVNAAQGATTTAANTGAGEGAAANGISATLTPFLTSELEHPQGYSQGDESAMLSSAEAGAGGATSAIAGKATEAAAQSHNAGGMQAVLDDAARSRTKAAAGASENVASQNAGVKLNETQDAAKQLQGMYGTDTSAMLDATGQEAGDINSEVNADKQGWLQNTEGIMNTAANVAGAVTGMKTAGMLGCWVAAEVYSGWLDPRTVLARRWIFGTFAKKPVGALVARAYLRYGERLAAAIRRWPVLRRPFKALMDQALRKAVA